MVLSDIPVHREQNPEGSLFFETHNDDSLANVLLEVWNSDASVPNTKLEEKAESELKQRTEDFANNYLNIVQIALNQKS